MKQGLKISNESFSERKKKKYGWILSAMVLLILAGCQEEVIVDRQKIMDDYIQKKLDDFESLRNTSCVKEAYRIATKEVDSLLIARAKMNRNQKEKPIIPPKPAKPTILRPLDSASVKPIFE